MRPSSTNGGVDRDGGDRDVGGQDHDEGGGDDSNNFVDITALVRRCASLGLSHSVPFIPPARKDAAVEAAASLLLRDGGGDIHDEAGTGAGAADGRKPLPPGGLPRVAAAAVTRGTDLREAMTALELGSVAMDCCEIPPVRDDGEEESELPSPSSSSAPAEDQQRQRQPRPTAPTAITFPPRIAPRSLSDGAPCRNADAPSLPTAANNPPATAKYPLLLPSPPCHRLLEHWNHLSILPPSTSATSSSLLPLLLLQLTALEAYVGTENGGSNAAETLYCVTWCHDGVLTDMAERLGVGKSADLVTKGTGGDGGDGASADEADADVVAAMVRSLENMVTAVVDGDDNGGCGIDAGGADNDGELLAARWTLFASSLGVVRVAEAIRWAVVNADFYEEEDFGVALHGGKDHGGGGLGDGDDDCGGGEGAMDGIANGTKNSFVAGEGGGNESAKKEGGKRGGSSMRFCPALRGSQYAEVVWDTALSHLRRYRASRASTAAGAGEEDAGGGLNNPTIDALESILRAQQSLFQAVKILSNLNCETVCDFTQIAARRSGETASLLAGLHENRAVAEILARNEGGGLVGPDGRLLSSSSRRWPHHPDDPLLSASFDPFVNRRLLGNAPVRRACFRRPADVLESLRALADELDWGVCEPMLRGNTYARVVRMLERNSLRGCGGAAAVAAVVPPKNGTLKGGKRDGAGMGTPVGMNVLSRSLLVLNLYFDDRLFGQHDFSEMMGQHMRQQCGVPKLLLEASCADGVPWLTRIAKPMYDALKALCLNRHRERGFTESILLPAFQLLQYEAATVDENFKKEHGLDAKATPSYATNYVILNTIRLMERHVGLGIELGLYPNWYDLSTALWYRDFLLSALINVRGSIERERIQRRDMDLRIKMEQDEEERKARTQSQQGKKRGKAKKGKKPKQPTLLAAPSAPPAVPAEASAKSTEEDFEDRLEYTSLLLHRNLCRGLVRYIAALRQAEVLPEPPVSLTMFTTHQRRFEKRFEAFGALPQPPHLSFDDYVRGSDFSAVQSKDLLASAAECFRSGKSVVDWLLDVVVPESVDVSTINAAEKRRDDDLYISIRREEIMAFAKVCVGNSLFLHKLTSVLAAAGQSSGGSKVSLEFKAHKQYCTLSIK